MNSDLGNTLARRGRRMALAAGWGAAALLIGYAALWLCNQPVLLRDLLPGLDNPGVGQAQRAVGFVLGALPVGAAAMALWQARAFFRLYEAGDVFPAQSGAVLGRLGCTLFVLAGLTLLMPTATSVLFSLQYDDGHRQLVIGISSTVLFLFIAAGLMVMIGRILTAATETARENREFV